MNDEELGEEYEDSNGFEEGMEDEQHEFSDNN